AVVDQYRAVFIDEHERTTLIGSGEVEGDAELHWRQCERPFGVLISSIELGDLCLSGLDLSRVDQLVPGRFDSIRMAHRLVIRGVLALGIKITTAKFRRAQPELRGHSAQQVLHHKHALWTAETAKRPLEG